LRALHDVMPRLPTIGLALALAFFGPHALAAEFRSTANAATVFYDAPSAKSRPLFVVNRGYPVEVMVTLEGWIKVRDVSGSIVWVEASALTAKRTVVVKTRVAEVRTTPDDSAPVAFKVAQDVLLEFVDSESTGWVRVRNADGGTGYVRAADV
jgi:SH3 domain protein